MDESAKLELEEFIAFVVRNANLASQDVSRRSRLGNDLGLDSLALVELLVALDTELGMRRVMDGDAEREWNTVTIGDLFEEYRYARRPPRSPHTRLTDWGSI